MKRYDITKFNDSTGIWQEVTQDPEGVWVKYSDVKILEEAIENIMYYNNNKLLRSAKRDIHYIGKKVLQEINR